MKTSNTFTLTRIILAPVLFLIYFIPEWLQIPDGNLVAIISSCMFIPLLAFAEFTDFLDGFFARRHNEVSDFGKMFDPFADVFLHLSMFTCFVFAGYMPPILYILILYREFSQNFLRMVAAKKGTAIAARKGGKLKTVMYVAACFMSLIQESLLRTGLAALWKVNMNALYVFGVGIYVVCVILSYISFIDYLIHFGSILKEAANEKK
ncbi:MAG: CDP-diacylglycerol--glycerol-3-phosphate 3-phosphatidyltransferase [Treponema sp.]|nr:CDP-diacylglycerol--glycerol-3-phosphate 3-phosphatidyltransferase [Treponema sp.]